MYSMNIDIYLIQLKFEKGEGKETNEVKFLCFTRTGDISMPVDSDKFHILFFNTLSNY